MFTASQYFLQYVLNWQLSIFVILNRGKKLWNSGKKWLFFLIQFCCWPICIDTNSVRCWWLGLFIFNVPEGPLVLNSIRSV